MQGARPQLVDQPAQRTHAASADRLPFFAADVGGTNARIGLIRPDAQPDGSLGISRYRKYACADYAELHEILRDFANEVGEPVAMHACIACAGLLRGDELVNANLPWRVSLARLRDELGLERVVLVNDFKAVAYAAHSLGATESVAITGIGDIDPGQPRLVLGPGTGLGVAVLLPGTDPSRPDVLATEGGHAMLAARTSLELGVVRRLGNGAQHLPNEEVFSGRGLLALHRTLCELRGESPHLATPEQITAAALAGNDALATETVEVFCGWLGSLVGDLVLMLGAYGGVYLAGGVLPQIAPLLANSAFASRLADKGVLRGTLERVPVRLIDHGQLGVTGAAHWFLDHELGKQGG
jgi:glucokinase